jgi:hypothetical protein
VWTGRSRSRGPKQSRNNSVPLGTSPSLRLWRRGWSALRGEGHRSWDRVRPRPAPQMSPGAGAPRVRWRIPPLEAARLSLTMRQNWARQRIQRRDVPDVRRKVIVDCAGECVVSPLDGLGRGQSISMDGSVAESESAQSCRSKHQWEGGSHKAAQRSTLFNDLKARACKTVPEDHRPGGDRAHTVAARPRRANSIAIKAPMELPARCGRSSPRSSR